MVPTLDLTIDAGADFHQSFAYKSILNSTTTPKNLNQHKLYMQIRHSPMSGVVLYDVDDPSYIEVTDPTQGIFTIHIPGIETAKFTKKFRVYDIFIVSPDSNTRKLIKGNITVIPAVTKELS